MSNTKEKRGPIATVEWIKGDRRVSDFIQSANLGINSVGYKERFQIRYTYGEVVTIARVMKAVNKMIEMVDQQHLDFKLSCPKVICIVNDDCA